MGNWEVNSIEVEEFEDRDFTVHLKRSLEAAKERKYKQALEAGKKALKLTNYIGDRFYCHVNIVKILFQMGEYKVCIKYIHANKLLKEGLNIDPHSESEAHSLLYDWVSYGELPHIDPYRLRIYTVEPLFIYYWVCCQKCNYNMKERQALVVSEQKDLGLNNLQEAIDICNSNQCIYIFDWIKNQQVIIKNKDIVICGGGIQGNDKEIDIDSTFYTEDCAVIEIISSNIVFNEINIAPYYNYGIYITGSSNVIMNACSISNCYKRACILATSGKVTINSLWSSVDNIITYGLQSDVRVKINKARVYEYIIGVNSNVQINNTEVHEIMVFRWGSEEEKMFYDTREAMKKIEKYKSGEITINEGDFCYSIESKNNILGITDRTSNVRAYHNAIININNCKEPYYYHRSEKASIKINNKSLGVKDRQYRQIIEEYPFLPNYNNEQYKIWSDIIKFLCKKEGWKDDSANFDLSSLDLINFSDEE